MSYRLGEQSIQFPNAPYILGAGSVVGEKEGQGPYGSKFDQVEPEPYAGKNTWEEAESELQRRAAVIAMKKAGVQPRQISYIFAGDLLAQGIATSFGLATFHRPLFGLFGACSTCGESLALGAMAVAAGQSDYSLCVTSSHFGSAEKQFRFPLEYGNQRPLSATWTVTGSGAFVVGPSDRAEDAGKAGTAGAVGAAEPPAEEPARSHVRITAVTPGCVVDYGVKDSMNMGAAMAPAACETIYANLSDFLRKPADYDRIITGDLGSIGSELLVKMLKEKDIDISGQHMDCGKEIFDPDAQDTHAGGSGCACSAVLLASHILEQLEKGVWKRVLFVPTGALLSTVSFNEGRSVPAIAHGIVLEHHS